MEYTMTCNYQCPSGRLVRGSSFNSFDYSSCCSVENANYKAGRKTGHSVILESYKVMNQLQEEEEYDSDNNIIHEECCACPFCDDRCDDECSSCSSSKSSSEEDLQCRSKVNFSRGQPLVTYTMCQVRRHDTKESAWLVAGGRIYDATQYVHRHPGGERSILKYAGGVKDCTEDMNFHSKNAIRLWKRFEIGILVKCPSENAFETLQDESVGAGCIIS